MAEDSTHTEASDCTPFRYSCLTESTTVHYLPRSRLPERPLTSSIFQLPPGLQLQTGRDGDLANRGRILACNAARPGEDKSSRHGFRISTHTLHMSLTSYLPTHYSMLDRHYDTTTRQSLPLVGSFTVLPPEAYETSLAVIHSSFALLDNECVLRRRHRTGRNDRLTVATQIDRDNYYVHGPATYDTFNGEAGFHHENSEKSSIDKYAVTRLSVENSMEHYRLVKWYLQHRMKVGEPMRVKRGGYGTSNAVMKGQGNKRSLRKPIDQWHCPACFPNTELRERPHWESNPVCLGGRRKRMLCVASELTIPETRSHFNYGMVPYLVFTETSYVLFYNGARIRMSTFNLRKVCGAYTEDLKSAFASLSLPTPKQYHSDRSLLQLSESNYRVQYRATWVTCTGARHDTECSGSEAGEGTKPHSPPYCLRSAVINTKHRVALRSTPLCELTIKPHNSQVFAMIYNGDKTIRLKNIYPYQLIACVFGRTAEFLKYHVHALLVCELHAHSTVIGPFSRQNVVLQRHEGSSQHVGMWSKLYRNVTRFRYDRRRQSVRISALYRTKNGPVVARGAGISDATPRPADTSRRPTPSPASWLGDAPQRLEFYIDVALCIPKRASWRRCSCWPHPSNIHAQCHF
ncbi:hypothetical protein PR048_009043 [Dryococelus australis]|uniref:Uncharacterized protein n=1 Tax=Dryococelus australis TaxID=614101 RepID=A0ABQ9HYT5_9NEOP|nr:hypothetical protein PR048_009043 [Dryococelus australis]